jgi:hypothetical protein
MKFNIVILALVATASAITIDNAGKSKDGGVDDDIDNLMDKYDGQESAAAKKKTEKKVPDSNGKVSASEVQDMELKILEGNNLAESSSKAEEDDFLNSVLDKYLTPGKTDKDLKKISKADAQEAASDLYQEKKKMDSFEATKQVN